MREALISQGTEPWTSASPEAFAEFIRGEMVRFSQLLKASGVNPK